MVAIEKSCSKCGVEQPAEQFVKIKRRGKDALSSWCKSCRASFEKQWRADNRERVREAERVRRATRSQSDEYRAYQRDYQRKWRTTATGQREIRANRLRLYGLTHEDFDRMVADQNGRCAICERHMSPPHIDHDHATGRVRELLCGPCNQGIGSLGDNVDRVQRALEYLTRHAGGGRKA